MAIRAIFKPGETKTIVHGLYQWDYGQVIEIESPDLIVSNVEVHFSCENMSEAIVRNSSVLDDVVSGIPVVSAVIPDSCLEQASNVTAWVYVIDGTQGHTALTVTLPIIARKRPSTTEAPTQEHTSKYEELITEVNEAIGALKTGAVVVEKAKNADKASNSVTAGNAGTAGFAQTAATAEKDKEGNKLVDAYHLNPINSGNKYKKDETVIIDDLCKPSQCGVYTINWETVNNYDVTTLPADIPEGNGAVKLIVEADCNTDADPAVFQTLKMRTLTADASKGIMMWMRQYNKGYWSGWQRFVSAKELTEGTLRPLKSSMADSAGHADEADYAHKAGVDDHGTNLTAKLDLGARYGEYAYYSYETVPHYQEKGASAAKSDIGTIEPGIVSFILESNSEHGTGVANVIVDLSNVQKMLSTPILSCFAGKYDPMGGTNRINFWGDEYILFFEPYSYTTGVVGIDGRYWDRYKITVHSLLHNSADGSILRDYSAPLTFNSSGTSTKLYYKYLAKYANGFPWDS